MIQTFESFFFLFFSSIIICLAFFTIQSKNTIYSILFLVLIFLNILNLLLLLKIEFFSILLIIIYMGAIAILFLFVIMMLDIQTKSFSYSENIGYLPICISILILFFIEFFFLFEQIFPFSFNFFIKNVNLIDKTYFFWISFLDNLTNIETIGQILYTYYTFLFLFSGIILLVALIGVVLLTLKKNELKNQLISYQISRQYKNAFFLIKNK